MKDYAIELADDVVGAAIAAIGIPGEATPRDAATTAVVAALRALAARGWHLVPYLGFGAEKGYLGKLADVIEGGALLARTLDCEEGKP